GGGAKRFYRRCRTCDIRRHIFRPLSSFVGTALGLPAGRSDGCATSKTLPHTTSLMGNRRHLAIVVQHSRNGPLGRTPPRELSRQIGAVSLRTHQFVRTLDGPP